MENVLQYTPAFVIGVLLGLMGGGGSILTVPLFVYVMGFNPIVATGYSLFVVGTTSLAGALTYARKKMLNLRVAIVFFIPSFVAVFIVRRFLLPAVPEELFSLGSFVVTKRFFIMIFFAVAMFGAALSMIRKVNGKKYEDYTDKINYLLFFLQALLVGIITGIAGAGGGFLIVPALVLLAHLKIRLAVGTSLLIISINSLIGFAGDIHNMHNIDWVFLNVFSGLSIGGIFLGSYLSGMISAQKLKKSFGWFIMIMSLVIIYMELNK